MNSRVRGFVPYKPEFVQVELMFLFTEPLSPHAIMGVTVSNSRHSTFVFVMTMMMMMMVMMMMMMMTVMTMMVVVVMMMHIMMLVMIKIL